MKHNLKVSPARRRRFFNARMSYLRGLAAGRALSCTRCYESGKKHGFDDGYEQAMIDCGEVGPSGPVTYASQTFIIKP